MKTTGRPRKGLSRDTSSLSLSLRQTRPFSWPTSPSACLCCSFRLDVPCEDFNPEGRQVVVSPGLLKWGLETTLSDRTPHLRVPDSDGR